jgi:hypothetical protein
VPAIQPYINRSPSGSSFVPSCPSRRQTVRSDLSTVAAGTSVNKAQPWLTHVPPSCQLIVVYPTVLPEVDALALH